MLGALVRLDPMKCGDAQFFLMMSGKGDMFKVVGVGDWGRACVANLNRDGCGHSGDTLNRGRFRVDPNVDIEDLMRRKCLFFVDVKSIILLENQE